MAFNPEDLSFELVKKQYTGKIANVSDADTLRVNGSYMSMSVALSDYYIRESGQTDKKSAVITLEASKNPPVLRLTPRQSVMDGYIFRINPGHGERRLRTAIPVDLKRKGLPKGLYKQIPEHPHLFVWQDPEQGSPFETPVKSSTIANPDQIGAGDRVSWQAKANDGSVLPIEGRVLRMRTPETAVIFIESPEYQLIKPGKHYSELNISKLTLIKKGS